LSTNAQTDQINPNLNKYQSICNKLKMRLGKGEFASAVND